MRDRCRQPPIWWCYLPAFSLWLSQFCAGCKHLGWWCLLCICSSVPCYTLTVNIQPSLATALTSSSSPTHWLVSKCSFPFPRSVMSVCLISVSPLLVYHGSYISSSLVTELQHTNQSKLHETKLSPQTVISKRCPAISQFHSLSQWLQGKKLTVYK